MLSFQTFSIQRLYPLAAFIGGFLWDALTLGQRVKVLDFWRLGGFLLGAALLIYWLAYRHQRASQAPDPDAPAACRLRLIRWYAPYLLLQFFFGGIFSALFILYVKSAGHLPAWLAAGCLGALLIANEFWRDNYARRFTLNWSLFALCAILLMNFALPHAAGSLDPRWIYLSTGVGLALAHGLYRLAPGRPGRIAPAWALALALLLAWHLDMIAPVPLVKRSIGVGQQFSQGDGHYRLQVEAGEKWQFWRDQATTVHLPKGGLLYGVSAVFAPQGVTAPLQHQWLHRHPSGAWVSAALIRFTASGGRTGGFRGYSYVKDPPPGEWRLIVATQDGHTITTLTFSLETGPPLHEELRSY
jgi:hypothetical protein